MKQKIKNRIKEAGAILLVGIIGNSWWMLHVLGVY